MSATARAREGASGRMIRQPGLLAAGLLALLVLLAPLPFGSVAPGAAATLETAAFLACALAAARATDLAGLRHAAPAVVALVAVAIWGALQSLPWPPGAVAFLSPEHARLYSQASELLAPAPGGTDPPAPPSGASPTLSLAPAASRTTALLWAAVAACLAAAAIAGRERRNRRLLGAGLILAALFQVVQGAQSWFARSETIWGVDVPGAATRLRGTFVNPDHAAAFLGIALPAAFAWGWWAARRARDELQIERRVLWVAPPVLVWLTLFAGLAFTGSRGGLVAAVTGVVVQGGLLALHTVARRGGLGGGPDTGRGRLVSLLLAPAGVVAALVGIGVVAVIGLQEGLGRLLSTTPYDVSWGARLAAYDATLDLWRRFPWTGSGAGTFREAFPLVQPADLVGTWRHAHSDPLELLATTGVLGVALVAIGLGAVVLRLAAVLQRGSRSEDRAAALAALGALAALAVHDAVDFGLTLPANAAALAIVVGAAVAAPTGHRRQVAAASARPAAGPRRVT